MTSAERRGEPSGVRGAAGCEFHPELIDKCWFSSALGSGLWGGQTCRVFPGCLVVRERVVYPLRPPQAVGAAGETSCVHHAVPWWGQQLSEYSDVRWFHHQPLCWRKGDAVRLMGESQ